LVNRLRELWDNLGRNNQIILVASTLGVAIALVGFIAWATTPEYVPLFSNLSAQDANAISDKLREANVSFRLQQGGTAIEVPAPSRDEMRMKIMSQGLPQQSSAVLGYELLDKNASMTQTEAEQDTTLLRAREGEISKSIMSLQQVASATVHIAAADNSPFIADKHPASASVLVALHPGLSLSDENVRAIVRMTQMSVSGLAEKDISVVDQQGNLLFDGTRGSSGAMTDDRMKEQHQLAQAKKVELQSALDNSIGPHKAIVLVNVELNADQKEIKTDSIQPGAVTQSQESTEELNGAGKVGAVGTPGAASNLPTQTGTPGTPTYAAATGDPNAHYKNDTTVKTMEPSRTQETTVVAPGHIEKLTVSALVDTKVPADQVAAIEQILKTSIGATPGDTSRLVTVSQIAFDRSGEETEVKAQAAARSSESTSRLLATLVPLAIMIVAFIMLARAVRRPQLRIAPAQLALAGAGEAGYSLPAGAPPENVKPAVGPNGKPLPHAEPSPNEPLGLVVGSNEPRIYDVIQEAFDGQLESILHLTRNKPEMVAMLLRTWTAKED
jgi:flagellar M-ring protein FliF